MDFDVSTLLSNTRRLVHTGRSERALLLKSTWNNNINGHYFLNINGDKAGATGIAANLGIR